MRRLAAVLLLLLLSTSALAEAPTGVALLARLADGGDADAQYGIGTYYMEHHSSDRELVQARDWLLLAARQEHVHAMHRLGLALAEFDVIRDESAALDWVRNAAEAGLQDAQGTLGQFLFEGVGAQGPDCAGAAQWLSRADDLGHGDASSDLVWVLATCPEESQRDGSRALRLAFHLVYQHDLKNSDLMDKLAAAYAAAGDFLSAEIAQQEAIDLASLADTVRLHRRLEAYRAREPWVHRAGEPY
ncbi:MAG: tetratricopeptide repeat protein [Pseudomonadota bacterium]